MHPNPRRILPVVLLVVVAVAAWWYLNQQRASAQNGALTASGTIEATQVRVAPELSGYVLEVLADEGQAVQSGEVLVRFNDTLLQAQLAQAQAALAAAQANYALAEAGPSAEQRQVAISAAELELTSAQQALDALNENAKLAAAQALQAIASIDKARDKAVQYRDNMITEADQADIDAAWAAVVIAKDKLDKAQDDFDPFEKKDEDNVTRAIFQAQLAGAQNNYDNLVERYNNIIGTSNQYDLALAEAEVALAEARLADARRKYDEVKDGPDPDEVAIGQERFSVAQANLEAAEADPTAEQLAVAQAQVDVAQSAIQVIQAQIEKLVIASPVDGIVLTRAIEPGELAVAGSPLLTLARLDDLNITVYVPEDRYGEVGLGQAAKVTVDSFPGEIFEAVVVRIADQAEFTPRNVQTEEGRRTTVFAIDLAVSNPQGKLKAGMPADVAFGD